jgi:hypothetical protein
VEHGDGSRSDRIRPILLKNSFFGLDVLALEFAPLEGGSFDGAFGRGSVAPIPPQAIILAAF